MKAQTFELNRCYNADCMKAMAAFPDGYFDLAVVDPPYFSGPERRGFYGSEEAFLEVSKEAHYWKMVANHRRDMLDKTRENLYKWHGSRKS